MANIIVRSFFAIYHSLALCRRPWRGSGTYQGEVVAVTDGDTIKVLRTEPISSRLHGFVQLTLGEAEETVFFNFYNNLKNSALLQCLFYMGIVKAEQS